MSNNSSSILRYANIILFALTVVVNSLAGGTTLIGNQVTAAVSDANSTLITPAGYVFSIWGIIYLLLGIFVVCQARTLKGLEFSFGHRQKIQQSGVLQTW